MWVPDRRARPRRRPGRRWSSATGPCGDAPRTAGARSTTTARTRAAPRRRPARGGYLICPWRGSTTRAGRPPAGFSDRGHRLPPVEARGRPLGRGPSRGRRAGNSWTRWSTSCAEWGVDTRLRHGRALQPRPGRGAAQRRPTGACGSSASATRGAGALRGVGALRQLTGRPAACFIAGPGATNHDGPVGRQGRPGADLALTGQVQTRCSAGCVQGVPLAEAFSAVAGGTRPISRRPTAAGSWRFALQARRGQRDVPPDLPGRRPGPPRKRRPARAPGQDGRRPGIAPPADDGKDRRLLEGAGAGHRRRRGPPLREQVIALPSSSTPR